MQFDGFGRLMRLFALQTQSTNDVYALNAYVLNSNNMVGDNFVADHNSLPKVMTPRYDKFR